MSASREKKQRQEILSAGPTQKELKEQKEARLRKQKTILYSVIGGVIAVAVIVLLLWHSGVFDPDPNKIAAATAGEVTISVPEMQYYYSTVRQNELYYQQYYSAYGISLLQAPYQSYDSNSSLGDGQVYNTETGQTYAQHFEESALNTARQIIALSSAADADGYALSADGKKQVSDEMKSLQDTASQYNFPNVTTFLTANYGKYLTEKLYESLLTRQVLASEYQSQHQQSLTYDDAAYDAYSRENPANVYSYDYRYAYISGSAPSTTDENGNTVAATDEAKAAAMAEAKAKAEALVSGVEAATGDKEEAFNTLVVAAVGETSTYAQPDGNLQTARLGNNLTSSVYYEWLTDASRVKGNITSVESTSGYYVVLFLNRYLNSADTVDVRHILVKAELTQDDPDTADVNEAASEPTEEQMQAAQEKAQALLDEYNKGEKTEDAFGELAKANSEDTGSASNGGLYTYVEKGTMISTFDEWIFDPARQSGDTGLVKNENSGMYGWHVMYFVRKNGPKWHEVADNALRSADMTSWLEGLEANYETAAVADGMAMVH